VFPVWIVIIILKAMRRRHFKRAVTVTKRPRRRCPFPNPVWIAMKLMSLKVLRCQRDRMHSMINVRNVIRMSVPVPKKIDVVGVMYNNP